MRGALKRRLPATGDYIARCGATKVTKWNALVVSLVLAMPLTLMLTLGPETRRQMW